jgi:hypothetical protein
MRAATFGVPRVSVWRCDAAADRPSALSRLGHEPDSKLGAHGLGTKLNHRGRRVLSYEPARKFVWHLCLRSEEDFRDWAVNSRRGAVFIPRDPDVAYAGKGWVDWEVRRLTQPRVEASKRRSRQSQRHRVVHALTHGIRVIFVVVIRISWARR